MSSELDHQVHRSVPTWYKPFQSKKWVLTKKFDLTTLLVQSADRRWLRLVGGSLSEFRVSPLLLMLEVYFMLLDARFYKDEEFDNNIQSVSEDQSITVE